MQEGTLASPKSAILTGRPMKMAFAMQQVQSEDAAAALRDIQHFGQDAAGEYATKIRNKRKKHVRRCFDQLVMREIQYKVNHQRRRHMTS